MRGCSCRGTAGFAHVSCLAEQAKILVAEAEENNLDSQDVGEDFCAWVSCGPVRATPRRRILRAWLGVLEDVRGAAGEGPSSARRNVAAWQRFVCGKNPYEDALSVHEAELSMRRRQKHNTQVAEQSCGRVWKSWTAEPALRARECYLGLSRLYGEE